MILYRIYQIVIMLPLMLVATTLTALTVIVCSFLGAGKWAGYYPPALWSKVMCWLAWVRVTVKGRENICSETSYVFVANHQGAYDIFTVYGWLNHNFRWMMKKELRKIPLVGYACEKAKQVYVDNSSPARLRKTMQDAESLLAGGMSVVVFPEGARTWDGHMRRFKKGAYMLAVEFNMPVVPLTIDGAFSVLPRFKKLPRPGHITLTIHPPVNPPAEGHDTEALMERTRAAIASALPGENS
ncbi:1-acyl-sn-glycerol-3-phosphate acyltransferase [Muribaculaceae bacterium Isolate-104 (HZI)]|jgi:1-acyl-sn-glycerol-3-phosphate acyltransferase|nr:1-acyl-sn-glycerol-3-phosphate acyltransferase [Muribaculaceae bacterium Isolate-104 (HZI)]